LAPFVIMYANRLPLAVGAGYYPRPDGSLSSLALPALHAARGGPIAVVTGGAAAGNLAAAVVGFLDDVLGDVACAPAERYGGGEGHGAKDDEERGRGERHRDAELGEGGEGRIEDDDGVPGYVRQEIAPGGAPDDAGEEVRQEGGSPLLMGAPLGTLLALLLGAPRRRLLRWMVASVVFWGAALTGAAAFGLSVFGG